MKGYSDKISQNNIVHNQSNLHDYEPFARGRDIKYAFLIAPGKIRITPAAPGQAVEFSELTVAEIDYTHDESGSYARKDARKVKVVSEDILEIDSYSDDKNYVIIYRNEEVFVYLDPAPGGIIDTYYDASDERSFGVAFKGDKAHFRLWSPPAGRIELLLFHVDGSPLAGIDPVLMKKGKKGVWSAHVSFPGMGDEEILLYQYRVYAYGKSHIALDPYAVSMGFFNPESDDKIGKGAVVRMDSPKILPGDFTRNFRNHKVMADPCDLIAYELHVRDFTSQPGAVDPEYAGTYTGFAKKVSYLKELGVTHVQLMPVMKFYTVDESDRSFSGSDAEQINYNWGYDPVSYFAPEGWFSSDPANPLSRISELRSLVLELHRQQIGVIFDVVYNHTHIVETFEHVAPGCYYRFAEEYKISGHSGAGPSLESRRPMVRKLMIDSLLHLIREYHADGFRFDLMSFTDHETMLMISETAGKAYDPKHPESLILQGEAWVFSDLNTDADARGSDAAVTKLNYPHQLEQLGIFNDTARDAIVGKPGVPGFVAGGTKKIPLAATAVSGAVKGIHPGPVPFNRSEFFHPYHLFAQSPANCLNFISIHDGLTLADRFRLMMPGAAENEIMLAMRLASLILFTSAGKIILHGGDEILRSKPLANNDPNSNRALTDQNVLPVDGVTSFHENSYASPDFTNMFRWDILTGGKSIHARKMLNFMKGLIMMRRSLPALRSHGKGPDSIRFLTASSHIKNEVPCIYLSFTDPSLHSMTFEFINGPCNERYYLAGEVHPPWESHNPEKNPYYLDFDDKGRAVIRFKHENIKRFDTGKWGSSRTLEIKLVRHCGRWETIEGAYSETGNNSIDAAMLDETGHVVIDLGQKDFAAIPGIYEYDPFLAFLIKNNPVRSEGSGLARLDADRILVVHNPSENQVFVPCEEITDPEKWSVIADANSAGTDALKQSDEVGDGFTQIRIEKGRVFVPGRNAAVIVRKTGK